MFIRIRANSDQGTTRPSCKNGHFLSFHPNSNPNSNPNPNPNSNPNSNPNPNPNSNPNSNPNPNPNPKPKHAKNDSFCTWAELSPGPS